MKTPSFFDAKRTKIQITAAIYCLLARFGFEFSMPIYALFAFNWQTCVVIWTLFAIWQLLSIPLAKWNKQIQKEAKEEETRQEYRMDALNN